ncbi:MAG: Fic family protein [Candidatus Aenigmatarchaeota archaeon]
MVVIRKRTVGGSTYYYIEHAVREGGKIRKREKYLGKEPPKNVEGMKRQFLFELYREKWYSLFDRIRDACSKELKVTPDAAAEKAAETFAIRFTYDSQRIEGSKLTLRETANLLERGITPHTKPVRDVKEAEAHARVFREMLAYKKELSLQAVLYWHKGLFENSEPEMAGRIREHQVAISGSKFVPPFPVELQPLLREFFGWYDRNKDKVHPVELAALVHLKFVTIHPFSDGNGRISRLMMNFVLNRHGYPMLNIPYEKRSGYYTALERSQTKKIDGIFVQWFFKRYAKEYKRYLPGRVKD